MHTSHTFSSVRLMRIKLLSAQSVMYLDYTCMHIHSPATLLGTLVQHLVTEIANQPITWQLLNVFSYLDV